MDDEVLCHSESVRSRAASIGGLVLYTDVHRIPVIRLAFAGEGADGNKSGGATGGIAFQERHKMIGLSSWTALIAAALLSAVGSAAAAGCQTHSAPHRVTVLELYTSEGCNSCPPADRWLSALPQRGIDSNMVIPLAFHV